MVRKKDRVNSPRNIKKSLKLKSQASAKGAKKGKKTTTRQSQERSEVTGTPSMGADENEHMSKSQMDILADIIDQSSMTDLGRLAQ
jgi:hypothetical protein